MELNTKTKKDLLNENTELREQLKIAKQLLAGVLVCPDIINEEDWKKHANSLMSKYI